MRVALIIVAFALGYAAPVQADPWTRADSLTQGAVMLTLTADYLQTRKILACARDGVGCVRSGDLERNPVMGERGERVPVELYFVGVAAVHTVAARALPQPWRRIAQVAVVAIQAKVIGVNWHYGYTLTF